MLTIQYNEKTLERHVFENFGSTFERLVEVRHYESLTDLRTERNMLTPHAEADGHTVETYVCVDD